MEELSPKSLQAFKEIVQTTVADEVRVATDILRQEIRASEKRTDDKLVAMEQRMDTKLTDTEDRIMGAMSDIFADDVKPTLTDHNRRITKLEAQRAS